MPKLLQQRLSQLLGQLVLNEVLSARGGMALGHIDDTGVAPGEVVAEYLQVIGDAAAEVGLELRV